MYKYACVPIYPFSPKDCLFKATLETNSKTSSLPPSLTKLPLLSQNLILSLPSLVVVKKIMHRGVDTVVQQVVTQSVRTVDKKVTTNKARF